MIHVIRKILVDDSNLTALVPASRVSLVMARQGMQRPYIAVDLEGTEVNRTNTGIAQEIYNIMVYITDTKISDAWAIHEKVKGALSEFAGTKTVDGVNYTIAQVSLNDVMTDAHELHDFYILALSFSVFVNP